MDPKKIKTQPIFPPAQPSLLTLVSSTLPLVQGVFTQELTVQSWDGEPLSKMRPTPITKRTFVLPALQLGRWIPLYSFIQLQRLKSDGNKMTD